MTLGKGQAPDSLNQYHLINAHNDPSHTVSISVYQIIGILFWGTEKSVKTDMYPLFRAIAENIHQLENDMQMLWHCHCILSSMDIDKCKKGHVQHLQSRWHVPMYWFIMASTITRPPSRSCVIISNTVTNKISSRLTVILNPHFHHRLEISIHPIAYSPVTWFPYTPVN